MIANLKIRRSLVVAGVAAAIIAGLLSIQLAAALTAAAAPPPAPPVSLDTLKTALAAEQARGAELQAQLSELNGLTASLSDALANTQTQVSTDSKSAAQLAKELKAAQGKLAELKRLLKKARARLLAMGDTAGAAATKPGGGSGTTGGGTTGGGTTGGGTTGSMSLSLSLAGGDVVVDWTGCSVSGFSGYAVVRSTDGEIHWPPEDRDTEIARVTDAGTTKVTDKGAPSGTMTYKVYCLRTVDHETKIAQASGTKQIGVP
jgi:hypothetical protein